MRRNADFLPFWYFCDGADAANGICGCSFSRNWSLRMPPGTPGEFCPNANGETAIRSPAVNAAAEKGTESFMSG